MAALVRNCVAAIKAHLHKIEMIIMFSVWRQCRQESFECDRDSMKTGIKYILNIIELESIFAARFKVNISYFLAV